MRSRYAAFALGLGAYLVRTLATSHPDLGLPRLIAFYSGTWQFGLIVGPAVSGLLYAIDPTVPYLTAAVAFGAKRASLAPLAARR